MVKRVEKQTGIKKHNNRLRTWIVAILIFIACYSLSLAVPMANNFTYYPIKKIECGWSQLYFGSDIFGIYTYHISKGPSILTTPNHLFCSPAEAESKGYTKG